MGAGARAAAGRRTGAVAGVDRAVGWQQKQDRRCRARRRPSVSGGLTRPSPDSVREKMSGLRWGRRLIAA
ncbi:hypothetical protein Arub01_28810 [Actinomadura rubrobrunea]|uniref:Uncharacterized protein n=1 Tax=Actinomadura rubrobrunea TaxID=115335 RepID=A0A9W6UWW2_9ACTN|nr:hypothetical protein Arub01_28810 [Actinomadura rubrobrunea]